MPRNRTCLRCDRIHHTDIELIAAQVAECGIRRVDSAGLGEESTARHAQLKGHSRTLRIGERAAAHVDPSIAVGGAESDVSVPLALSVLVMFAVPPLSIISVYDGTPAGVPVGRDRPVARCSIPILGLAQRRRSHEERGGKEGKILWFGAYGVVRLIVFPF